MFESDVSALQLALLLLATFLAGFVDAAAGGGGLIQLPALLAAFPQALPAHLFATNKLSSLLGTFSAALRYARRVEIEWNAALPAAAAALVFSFLGAFTVTRVSAGALRTALPFVLLALLVYTLVRKDFGGAHRPRLGGARERAVALCSGAGIGFYEGFFGPGTGTFLVFLFVRVFGYSFLSASVAAKIVNAACNFSALLYFAPAGYVWWKLGLVMAVLNILGAQLGSVTAIARGSGFVRGVFLVVVGLLILRSFHDAFLMPR